MADPVAYQQESTASTSGTETVTVVEVGTTDGQPTETLQLKLRKPRNDKKVQWSTETVDNEHMNKKNSKSCCIYKKPREFGESSSDEDSDDDHDDHCMKHVEKKKAMEKQAETTENSTVMENDQTVETTIDNLMESVEEMRKDEESMDENKTEPPDDEQV